MRPFRNYDRCSTAVLLCNPDYMQVAVQLISVCVTESFTHTGEADDAWQTTLLIIGAGFELVRQLCGQLSSHQ